MRFFPLAFLILLTPGLNGFVFLSGPSEAGLEVDTNNPTARFVLSSEVPSISDGDSFLGGRYAGVSQEELWQAIVTEAMQRWNDVSSSYVELTLDNSTSAALNSDDRVNSIVVGSTNLSASAFARPTIENDKIVDCDIQVGNNSSVSAKSLAYTLLHELGHCLGLGHNHTNYDAVMSYSREDRSLKLGADDKAGLIYLYPAAGSGADDPKELVCGTIAAHRSLSLVWLWLLPLIGILVHAGYQRQHSNSTFRA